MIIDKIDTLIETDGMIAVIDNKIITEKESIPKIKEIIKPPAPEINEKEAETEREAGVMTSRVINMKNSHQETEITIEDNIEVKILKNLANKKFLLIVKMMITLITQMKMKDM